VAGTATAGTAAGYGSICCCSWWIMICQSEYQPLRTLAEIGKRSLIVLNKTDLYTEADRNDSGTVARTCAGFIATTDIVAIAANPQSVVLENGETFQPEPDIMPLRRMAVVLRAEEKTWWQTTSSYNPSD